MLCQVDACRAELLQLKAVWDQATLVECVFAAWRATPWAEVDIDALYAEGKRLQSTVRALERTVRAAAGWDVYTGLCGSIDNMLVALPLVQDLRDGAMRERHWKRLMRLCGRAFAMDDKCTLNDLLRLSLHHHADAVSEIGEAARAELKIDQQLVKIEAAWMSLRLEYVEWKSSSVMVLDEVALAPVYEALDEHEVSLQNMMSNRFMGHFEAGIASWKGKLAGLRATLDAWMEVQRSWCSLEAIFIGSDDIREQLPEDAKRFDGLDSEFKEHSIA
jgi:dynein heavy chain